ncbi:TauD/TfdA family dioxygenase [Streptomyces sp. NPDC051940]|uniref:TauD/TfdA family dioxygenase n=1 Tax=Streptomyces sp. NPDC051940 TaxID=3155675 RepID=UPI00341ED133
MRSAIGTRRRVAAPGSDIVTVEPPRGLELPLTVRPAVPGVDLAAYAADARTPIDGWLDEHGAVLFRGFDVCGAAALQSVVSAAVGDPLEYRERSTPRSTVEGNIYTSTEYPAAEEIPLHCENSYAHSWPLRLILHCATPAQTGGATPLADCRRVLERISPPTLRRFTEHGVRYVRNLGGGIGLDWREVFQTDDRNQVEAQCRLGGYDHRWAGDRLRLSRVAPAVVRHPRTGVRTWFNHAVLFHPSSLPAGVRDELTAEYGEDGLPNCTYFGDGSPIPDEVVDELRAAYAAESIVFPWQRGDVVVVDNMLMAHGRQSFTGPRQVLVAMGQPCTADSVIGGNGNA